MAVASPVNEGWAVSMELVGSLPDLLTRLHGRAVGRSVLLGLDLPIGLPRAYVELYRPEAEFPAFLRGLPHDAAFFQVCLTQDQISPDRPFYPQAPGSKRRHHLTDALKLASGDLLRACDGKTANRPAASALFWTLGANQVGKGALSAWHGLIGPALHGADPPALWPFDGLLADLLTPGRTVIAECYPAEAMRQLDLPMNGSKRHHPDRVALMPKLRRRMEVMGVRPDAELETLLANGMGADAPGEDRLDALLGLLGMLQVVTGRRADAVPDDPWVRRWEGWVLGQAVPARCPVGTPDNS